MEGTKSRNMPLDRGLIERASENLAEQVKYCEEQEKLHRKDGTLSSVRVADYWKARAEKLRHLSDELSEVFH
jgi:hypothetical protein